ncbi:MAG: AAA family ATPase [archaeon]
MQLQDFFEERLSRQTVFRDRNAITPHYVPETLPFRESQIRFISENLVELCNNKKSNNVFVYGKTGTGKTVTVRHVISQLLEFAKGKNLGIRSVYVNCRTHPTKYKVLAKAVQQFFPEENFLGFSSSFVNDKLISHAENNRHLVLVLDEIDKVRDLDELVYALTRANDELSRGSISIIGISNNVLFKERLDPRTKSGLCQREIVFAPYNAEELRAILDQRAKLAFNEGKVSEAALCLASALAAKESGDARTAVMLLLRAGEMADAQEKEIVDEEEVRQAKASVEEEIIYGMISTLPQQEQLVLYAISSLSSKDRGFTKISGETERTLFSGEVYEEYRSIAKQLNENAISARWYREYLSELEMYGLITTTASGHGIRGQTRLIKPAFDPKKISAAIQTGMNHGN